MKKYFALTLLPVLAACGGGSGGGSVDPRITAITSNANVTGMNTFVVIGGNSPTINPNARNASTGTTMADGGVRYDLSNVNLHTTTFTEDFVSPDAGATITFDTDDNGKITKISATGPAQFPGGINATRTSDNNDIFVGNVTFRAMIEAHDENGNNILDENGDPTYIEENLTFNNFKMKYTSFGKNMKLAYADFGSLDLAAADEDLIEGDGEYFAGGYQVKKIDPTNIVDTPTFTGTARGMVAVGYEDDNDARANLPLSDNNATLTFNSGVSTLNAHFDNWYDVSATMDNTGNLSGIDFTNGNKETFANGYQFNDANPSGVHHAAATQYYPGGGNNKIREGFIEYYGDGIHPAEAVGTVKYAESNGGHTDIQPETLIEFRMGFGVKKD